MLDRVLSAVLHGLSLPRVDVAYAPSATVACARGGLADVYLPVRASGASFVLVHGGGFVLGSRRMRSIRRLAAGLTSAGIAVFAIDYRLVSLSRSIADARSDVVAACAYWRRHAGAHGRSIALGGLSAGASLSLLAARQAGIDRVVSCFGLYDVDHLTGAGRLYTRLIIRDHPLPCHALGPDVPVLLLHGTADRLVPVEQALRLAAQRRASNMPTRMITYAGAPHGFFNYAVPAAELAIAEIAAFVGEPVSQN